MPFAWMPVVAVLAGSGSTERPLLLAFDRPAASSFSSAAFEAMRAPLATDVGTADGEAPACVGDVCQPRVAVPGYEPKISSRGKRTELAAHLLDRARLEPLASISHFLVATGLRFEFTPAALDRSTPRVAGGWGRAQLSLRWRIDASLRPVWSPESPR
jgi:hypothetical protein